MTQPWHNGMEHTFQRYSDYIPFFLDEKFWDEIFRLIRNTSKFLIFKIPATGQDIVEGLIVIITQKRRQSTEAKVKKKKSSILLSFPIPVHDLQCATYDCSVTPGLICNMLLSKKISRQFPFSLLFACLNNHPSSLTNQALLSFMVGHIF